MVLIFIPCISRYTNVRRPLLFPSRAAARRLAYNKKGENMKIYYLFVICYMIFFIFLGSPAVCTY